MTSTNSTTYTISVTALQGFTETAFRSVGLSSVDAQTAADVLVTTDAWGVFTHGTKSLHGYLRMLKGGGLKLNGTPVVVSEGPAWAIVDGDAALAMITSVFAMRNAIAKAKVSGIAYVGVRNSCHFGAAGYYSWLAAKEGLMGFSMANDTPTVASPGSRGAITGSNPFSYAVPAGKHRVFFLDMSVATVAGGKVYAARQVGASIPGNWLVGGDGQPTTDPSGFPEVGALQPAAAHKGFGLALMIETLSGLMTGAGVTRQIGSWLQGDPSKPTNHGAAFLAIDLNAIMPMEDFVTRAEELIDEIHAAPRADGVDQLFLPGEIEWGRLDRAYKEGIAFPADVIASLRDSAGMSGQNFEKTLGLRA